MNKVITVNLNGLAFQLEETGYDTLRAYLAGAAAKLAANPDKDEIISDIERAIADKFRALLGAHKTVVVAQEVETVIAELGPVDDGSDAADAGPAKAGAARATGEASPPKDESSRATGDPAGPAKRLYKIADGAMFTGVCNGLGAYFNVDTTLVRLAFVVLAIVTGGAWLLAYLVLMLVVPAADTAAEKAAAYGANFTAQEFIRRAKAGYYEGMKTFPDKHARREWKRRFKRDLRAWSHSFRWEMRSGAMNWQRYWTENTQPIAGWSIALPFISLLRATLAIALIATLVSLLATGAIFGEVLPAGIPVWAGIILLFIGYLFIVLPLKAARHIFYYHGGAGRPFFFLWEALVWLGFFVAVVWLAKHYSPELRDAIHNIPPTFHHAADSIRRWWARP